MHQYNAESFVSLAHAHRIAEEICRRSEVFCQSIDLAGADKLLTFEDARAILRPVEAGLRMRVEGQNLVVFCGVRTLLQGQLSALAIVQVRAIEWEPAGHVPFRTDGATP
ncbi:hypothetical protein [Rhizobium sp. SYY.PMSO]|uniref:SMa0974 family conjugal transfer regulator n=1 Tax=Rhizobium sp. SYY.PMSO TaxID=3382192 RepID=UPI000DDD1885